MNYTILKKLPTEHELMQYLPVSQELYKKIQQDREEIKNILSGKDNRLLMIIGPCSAWPKDAVLEYACRLAYLNETHHTAWRHKLKIIMRLYIQKPRTTYGWTGPMNQPNPFTSPDMAAGMFYAREMMIKVLEMGLPIADEALFTNLSSSFLDLLSWIAIGARSGENQQHRVFASANDCPVGMKNPTHGALSIAVNSVIAAQHSHHALFEGYEVKTHGNPYAHIVLRGSNREPNYSTSYLREIACYMQTQCVLNPAIIIDASHDNCWIAGKKDPNLQPDIVFQVMHERIKNSAIKNLVKGFMVESFLKEGHQIIEKNFPEKLDLMGLSITDPCLGWERTEAMLIKLAKIIA